MTDETTTPTTDIAVVERPAAVQAHRADHRIKLQPEGIATLKETYAADLTDSEFRLFVAVAQERGLNPLNRQIHAIVRGKGDKRKVTFQTSIDAFRLIAQRTNQYGGQTPVEWCGRDGRWTDTWLSDEVPAAARVGIIRKGFHSPLYAVAHYREFVQTTEWDGRIQPNSMWQKMPANQLSKCAEALGLRKAFPEELSGMYTDDEMGQADGQGQYVDVAASDVRQTTTIAPASHQPTVDMTDEIAQLRDDAERDELRKWWGEVMPRADMPKGCKADAVPETRVQEVRRKLKDIIEARRPEDDDPKGAPFEDPRDNVRIGTDMTTGGDTAAIEAKEVKSPVDEAREALQPKQKSADAGAPKGGVPKTHDSRPLLEELTPDSKT